eukprot:2127106-Pleurochrysis_carterae.AAC.1
MHARAHVHARRTAKRTSEDATSTNVPAGEHTGSYLVRPPTRLFATMCERASGRVQCRSMKQASRRAPAIARAKMSAAEWRVRRHHEGVERNEKTHRPRAARRREAASKRLWEGFGDVRRWMHPHQPLWAWKR